MKFRGRVRKKTRNNNNNGGRKSIICSANRKGTPCFGNDHCFPWPSCLRQYVKDDIPYDAGNGRKGCAAWRQRKVKTIRTRRNNNNNNNKWPEFKLITVTLRRTYTRRLRVIIVIFSNGRCTMVLTRASSILRDNNIGSPSEWETRVGYIHSSPLKRTRTRTVYPPGEQRTDVNVPCFEKRPKHTGYGNIANGRRFRRSTYA